MKPLAVSLTGISKSSNTSVSYFLFWHNQSSKLSRHDRIWQVPRTLAKKHKEKAEGSHFGFSLPISLASYVFGKCLFWKRVLCPMSNITCSHNTLWSFKKIWSMQGETNCGIHTPVNSLYGQSNTRRTYFNAGMLQLLQGFLLLVYFHLLSWSTREWTHTEVGPE